jgi:hypothetical protein
MLQRNFDRQSLIDPCRLALETLFTSAAERQSFTVRLREFVGSDDALRQIVNVRGNILSYESESFVPPQLDLSKPNLFFVVGNPAPKSILLRAMYAYEGVGVERQHRFWKVMHSTGILRFSQSDPDLCQPREKMQRLYAGHYESLFNIHIVPFFSLASPPAGQWAGVVGLRRLFGNEFHRLVAAELTAVRGLVHSRMKPGDCLIVLQKDAYMALKPPQAPVYDGSLLRSSAIVSKYTHDAVNLICLPPTRLLYSRVTQSVLREQVARARSTPKSKP